MPLVPKASLAPSSSGELMRVAQETTYADAIDPDTYHPYMWLWKPHYYAVDYNFYNFPYAFGHLFSLGLYAVYRNEGESFIPRYKTLLRETGQDDAAPLAARFDIDIRSGSFSSKFDLHDKLKRGSCDCCVFRPNWWRPRYIEEGFF